MNGLRTWLMTNCFMLILLSAATAHSQHVQPHGTTSAVQSDASKTSSPVQLTAMEQSASVATATDLADTASAPQFASGDDATSKYWHWPTPLGELQVPKPAMPRLRLPSLRIKPLWGRNEDTEVNTGDSLWTSSTEVVAGGVRKVADGTRQAWQGAKQMFTGRQQSNPPQRTAERTSAWQRVFGPSSENQQPETIGEFMKQKRIRH